MKQIETKRDTIKYDVTLQIKQKQKKMARNMNIQTKIAK